jgi:hypothetical protein
MWRPSLSTEGEGNMNTIVMRDSAAPPWSKAILRKESRCRNLGSPMADHKPALVRIGKTMSRSR